MKKILGLGFIILLMAGCLKSKENSVCGYTESSLVAPQVESDSVQAYLDSNNLTATKHASGLYYSIINPGTGASINNLCTILKVTYKGTLKNGTIFDAGSDTTAATFELGRVIPGWQKGLPLIKEAGRIILYIPPSLAYGATDIKENGVVVIPANSMLIFDINLLALSNTN
ncbi:MAG: FKBP-type peptidyl-prolyl cis-trans isomerase [Ginsengibacter sp.]